MAKYEFAIKKDTLNSGKVVYSPVCREKAKLFGLFPNPWNRITKIYDNYTIMELDWIPELTFAECEEHIKGYQLALAKVTHNEVVMMELQNYEEKQI